MTTEDIEKMAIVVLDDYLELKKSVKLSPRMYHSAKMRLKNNIDYLYRNVGDLDIKLVRNHISMDDIIHRVLNSDEFREGEDDIDLLRDLNLNRI